MWSDNETTVDQIGFRVHAALVRSVVTDQSLLPVVLGLFGDWGSGKSSIMRMLQQDFKSPEHGKVACLYFNGWMFEGYEDAKTALLSSILLQLGEHERFGEKVKGKVVGLLKRVKWMEAAKLGVRHIGVPLVAGLLTGGVGALPALLASLIPGAETDSADSDAPKKKGSGKKSKDGEENWLDLIKDDPSKPDLLEIRKFREDFADMLDKSDIESLVILIDDLDRCLPERIIETLEAIKLFVLVPHTAFVIGADPRIVRHAIGTRYVKRQIGEDDATKQEEYDLVKDYLEKLIQIPYHLPRLSPAEVETYINLLACQKFLRDGEDYPRVLEDWSSKRSRNFYAAYQHGAIREALGGKDLPDALARQLTWSNAIALVITEGLKGNPRQVKRMLNAMLLRKKLADVARIEIKDEVLAKLMVLEYTHLNRFQQLNNWQARENGFPAELKRLEEHELEVEGAEPVPEEIAREWLTPSLKNWLRVQPSLRDVDLRDYFWLARDRTSSTLAGVQMVSSLVRRLFDSLIGENEGERHVAAGEVRLLNETELEALLGLLRQHVERYPGQTASVDALILLAEEKVEGASSTALSAIRNATPASLEPSVAYKVKTIGAIDERLADEARATLEQLRRQKDTPIAAAAEVVLEESRE